MNQFPHDGRIAPTRRQFAADRSGEVVIEYALIGAMAAIIAIGAFTLFAESAVGVWNTISTAITSAGSSGS